MLPGNVGGNCIGVGGGGTEMGPENGPGKGLGCSCPMETWLDAWEKSFFKNCGGAEGKGEEEFDICGTLLCIFV